MSTAKAVLGGLMKGTGRGMVDQYAQRREDALIRAQQLREDRHRREDMDYRSQENELDREHRSEENSLDRSSRRGLMSRIDTRRDGGRVGVTSGGDVVDLGYQAPVEQTAGRSGGRGSGGDEGMTGALALSAEEKRIYDEMKQRYTDPNTGFVDWQGLVGHLRDMPQARGGTRWNEIADHLTGDVGTRMTEAEAREQAEREARSRTSMFRSREEEFPDTDGDREAWIEQRARELIGGDALVSDQQTPQAQSGQSASQSPPGGGTQVDPYRASTQADIDWFLEQAPAGAVIEVDGELYTK